MGEERHVRAKPVPTIDELMTDPSRAAHLAPDEARCILVALASLQRSLELVLTAPSAGSDSRALRNEHGGRRELHLETQVENRLLSVKEVAARLGVTVDWCYRHGELLGARRLSHRVLRFPESAIMRHLENGLDARVRRSVVSRA